MPPNLPIRQNYCTLSVWSLLFRFNASARRTYLTLRAFGLRLRSVIHTAAPPTSQPRRLSLHALTVLLLSILAFNIKNYITRNENCQPKFTKRKNRRKVSRRSQKKEKIILMPAEQFKSTLTRACWCKLLNCSGARFLRIFAKKPCTLKRITF